MAEERRQLLQPCHWVGEEGQDCPILSALPAKWRARFRHRERHLADKVLLEEANVLPFLLPLPGSRASGFKAFYQETDPRQGGGREALGWAVWGGAPSSPTTNAYSTSGSSKNQ